jgi:asparagine synthase (glutamine-hydrolysing)
MCGITGIFNLNNKAVNAELLHNMTSKIAHRGPDGEGYFVNKNIGLSHKRLSILDVSTKGKQPMTSKNQEWVVVFNGCVYNWKELKKDLISKEHRFISQSDTEVIVEGLAEYGISFFEKLNGMFAIGAWNTKKKKLFLSRDRFGIKPLYYWFDKKTLVFSSEIKSIIEHPSYSMDIDLDVLNEYFTFQNVFSFRTLFKNVWMLPPANSVEISENTKFVKHESWWDYDFSNTDENMTFEFAKSETKRLFKQAVKRQLTSDVPVGAYLSGGMDSGSITAIASEESEIFPTFTCGFDMNNISGREVNFDERRDAELMASYFKTQQYEQVINSDDLRHALPKLVNHLEDLRLGMSYSNYYIARLASKFVKVCLQGTGGDELFGGYPWRYYKVMGSINQKDFFNQYYDFWQRLVPDNEKGSLFTEDVLNKIDLNEPRKIFERVFTFNDKLKYDYPNQHINNSLYFEAKTFLSGLFLVGDKLSMANGLEERFPFMDNDLVNFAMKIPAKFKLGNLKKEIEKIDENTLEKAKIKLTYREYDDGKNVLRKAMEDIIPNDIINRKKQGFSSPDESWFRGDNIYYVKELLLNKNTMSTKFIKKSYIKKIIDEHINKKTNHRLLIWSLMNFELWCRTFLNK